jgi:hypothetical protein
MEAGIEPTTFQAPPYVCYGKARALPTELPPPVKDDYTYNATHSIRSEHVSKSKFQVLSRDGVPRADHLTGELHGGQLLGPPSNQCCLSSCRRGKLVSFAALKVLRHSARSRR